MKRYIEVAAYTTLFDVALVALIVGLAAGTPEDRLRGWLGVAIVALGAIAFVAGLVGAGIERMDSDKRVEHARADFESQLTELQSQYRQQVAAQFLAGFEHANNLHANAVDSVAKSWGQAVKRIPHVAQVIGGQGALMSGGMAELMEGDGQEPLEL